MPTTGVPGASGGSRAFKVTGIVLLVGCMALFAGSLVLRSEPVYGTWACMSAWLTDFRADLPTIDVPTR